MVALTDALRRRYEARATPQHNATLILPTASPTWFVIWTRPKVERKVAGELARLGYQVLCPTETVWRRIPARQAKGQKNKRRKVERPLFPRYLFVGFDPLVAPWWPVRATEGVAGVVSIEGEPLKVRTSEVERLRQAIEAGDHDKTVEAALAIVYGVGETVRITSGPFADFTATVEACGARTARVDIISRHGSIAAEIPLDALSSID